MQKKVQELNPAMIKGGVFMRKFKKGKIMSCLIALFNVIWLMSGSMMQGYADYTAYASEEYYSDGTLLYQKIDSLDSLIVAGAETEVSGQLQIPSSFMGMNVTEIRTAAFSDSVDLESVILPDTIIKIDMMAFSGCTALADINIGNSVQSVGGNAFAGTAWSAMHENDDVAILNDYILVSVSDSVTELNVPESVRVIADRVCINNKNLRSAVFTGNTSYIGEASFAGCENLKEIILPNGVKNIGNYAFESTAIEKLTVPSTVIYIGQGAFTNCTSLSQITLWNGLERISASVFECCTALKEVDIPDTVTEIGHSAFKQCSGLQNVRIGSRVSTLPNYVFQECTSLTSVSIAGNLERIGTGTFNKCLSLGSIVLPQSVKVIGAEAFQSCVSLTDINLHENILDIGVNAFFDTAFYINLKAMYPESDYVIYDDRVLLGYDGHEKSIELPSGIEIICGGAFSSDNILEEITFPVSARSLSSYAFDNLFNLKTIRNSEYLEYVGAYAFCDCTSLMSMSLSGKISTIERGTFLGCESLNSVNLGQGIHTIKQEAFSGCISLDSINLPEDLELVESEAFDETLAEITVNDRECVLSDNSVDSVTVIRGYLGSTAEYYANANGNKFVSLDEIKTTETTVSSTVETATTTDQYIGETDTTDVSTTTTTTVSMLAGDMNGDDEVNMQDASIILDLYANTSAKNEVDTELLLHADVNRDGVTDINDALMVLQYYVERAARITDKDFAAWRESR